MDCKPNVHGILEGDVNLPDASRGSRLKPPWDQTPMMLACIAGANFEFAHINALHLDRFGSFFSVAGNRLPSAPGQS